MGPSKGLVRETKLWHAIESRHSFLRYLSPKFLIGCLKMGQDFKRVRISILLPRVILFPPSLHFITVLMRQHVPFILYSNII